MKKNLVIAGISAAALLFSAFRYGQEEPVKIQPEQLGEMLFFDPILSEDYTISCASCHKPEFAFADTAAFSSGVHGKKTRRNTPSVMNMLFREALFWDGRATTLEEQTLMPIEDPDEMNLPIEEALSRLNHNGKYKRLFQEAFGTSPDRETLMKALAAYERSLETDNTPNDRWLNDEPGGLNEQQIRGREIFRNKGKCIECHFTPDFTGDEFRSIGLFNGRQYNDSGRYHVTGKEEDIGKFKVPGLRNVAVTAPYMHDGSFSTLRMVIDYYDNPLGILPDAQHLDSLLLEPLHLTAGEKEDLEAFLHSLTDDRFYR